MAAASGRFRCTCRRAALSIPTEPAPVNARTSTIKRIAGSIIAALAQVMPDRAPAASAGRDADGGVRRTDGDGRPFVIGELIAGGSGAVARRDGVDVIETDATNCMNLPAEAMEMEAPIRLHRVALRMDPAVPACAAAWARCANTR